jgi:RNase P subunit RPR2
MVTGLVTVNGNRIRLVGGPGLVRQYFLPLSYVSTSRHSTGIMQSLDYRVFCQTCRELTYREVRYRFHFQFVGRLLVCQNCGKTILEPVGTGTAYQDCGEGYC